uniref:Disease resistance R13L4/SHOC-2-like LRR domain-containing protein n=1 Tax=Lotharella globosa TaxID=91324 RepID=A0A7S3ZGJ6_9EUKA
MRENFLVKLPREIGQCHELRVIDVSFNRLSTLPRTIGELHQLHTLNVNHNHLENLPMELGECKRLQRLSATSNNLVELPIEDLAEIETLRLVDARHNPKLTLSRENSELLPPSVELLLHD